LKKVVLRHADKQIIKNKNIFHFDGNVEMQHDTINIKSDYAIYYKTLGIITLTGNVRIKTTNSIVKSHYGTFFERESKAIFRKNAYFENNESKTNSDTLIHYYKINRSELYGNAVVLTKSDSSITKGKRIFNLADSIVNVLGNAIYEKKQDNIKILADTIDFYKKEMISIAKSNVKVHQIDVRTSSQLAKYITKDSILKLYTDPVVYFKNNEIRGDSIFARYNSKRLEKIDVLGSGITLNVVDSLTKQINRIEGREIYMYFDDQSELERIRSISNAISLYYLQDNNQNENGINSVSGDSLHINFKDNALFDIKAYGGVKGTYYPVGYKGAIKNEY
jgi:lipopolysaccharide export system protein LptA